MVGGGGGLLPFHIFVLSCSLLKKVLYNFIGTQNTIMTDFVNHNDNILDRDNSISTSRTFCGLGKSTPDQIRSVLHRCPIKYMYYCLLFCDVAKSKRNQNHV